MKIHVGSQRIMEKSNSHEGIPRVTREVNGHLICYIYTLIVQENDFFTLASPIKHQRDRFITSGEQVMAPTLHYWS